ncbi:hypothetical protein LMG19083_04686 [Ralstonia psammae]|uniref:Uncharacterized protein n=1 Tax=Ralstonia psammae TaxID=3058598 RepID=A0ABN9JDQ4_9RALS|nr:hypothetical protein [Ralstonia sp. LMG 19083]CAJ0808311.1 hypothetical protein LMG19083_04686 [Ralstonia sp. LMG 19083]
MHIHSNLAQSSAPNPAWSTLPDSGIHLRRPRGMADAQAIACLRQEINLAVHTELDPQFLEHEKKEMS